MVFNEKFNIPSTRELIKMLINSEAWKSKTPLQKWSYLYGIARSLNNVIKMTPYKEDQTLSWFSYYPLFYVSVHFILMMYTIAYYLPNGEFDKFLPCTCVFVGPGE